MLVRNFQWNHRMRPGQVGRLIATACVLAALTTPAMATTRAAASNRRKAAQPAVLHVPATVHGFVGGESHDTYALAVRPGEGFSIRLEWKREASARAEFELADSADFPAHQFEPGGKWSDGGATWTGASKDGHKVYVHVVAHPSAHYTLEVRPFPKHARRERIPDPGEPWSLRAPRGELLVKPAEFWPFEETRIDGFRIRVAVNDRAEVAYVATADATFGTRDGISVGSTLAQVRKAGASEPVVEAGWAYITRLPSGWWAAFVSGEGLTNAPLTPQSKVAWLFKRR